MLLSKLLWFLYKPKDEREKEIFYKAYMRSFATLVALLITYILTIDVLIWADVIVLSKSNVGLLIDLVLLQVCISYFHGFFIISKEDLNLLHDKNVTSKISLKKYLFVIASIVICSYLFICYFPIYTFITITFFALSLHITSSFYAYSLSKSMSDSWRKILVIVFPNLVIPHYWTIGRNFIIKIFAFVGFNFIIAGLSAFVMFFGLYNHTGNGVVISSNTFEPEFEQCHVYLLDKRIEDLQDNDLIQFDNEKLGKIISYDENDVTLLLESKDIVEIGRNEVTGKLLNMKFTTTIKSDCEQKQ